MPSEYLGEPHHPGAALALAVVRAAHDVSRRVADQGHGVIVQRREGQLARLSRPHGLTVLQNLVDDVVFVGVDAAPGATLQSERAELARPEYVHRLRLE